jgi:hypothetical protein
VPWVVCALGRYEIGSFCALSCYEFGSFCAWVVSSWVVLSLGCFVMGRFVMGCFELGPFRDRSFCMCISVEFRSEEKHDLKLLS